MLAQPINERSQTQVRNFLTMTEQASSVLAGSNEVSSIFERRKSSVESKKQ